MRRHVQGVAVAALLWGGPTLAGDVRPGGGAAPAVDLTARGAFEALRREQPAARATYRPGQDAPAMVTGLTAPTTGATPAERAADFLVRHPGLLGVPVADLKFDSARTAAGHTVIRFEQRHGGDRVYDASVAVTLDDAGRVLRLVNAARPVVAVDAATIDVATARALAVRAVLGVEAPDAGAVAMPVLFARAGHGTAGFEVLVAQPTAMSARKVLVDAHEGRVIGIRDGVVK